MNKLLTILSILLLPSILLAEETPYDHIFFDNARMTGAWFYSEASYTSPSYLQTSQNKLPVTDTHAFTPSNSILLNYISAPGGNWSATLLYPDWRGKDFIKAANSLDFRLLVSSDTQPAELPLIAIATKDQQSISQYVPLQEFVENRITSEWIHISIPLEHFGNIKYVHTQEIKQILFKQNNADGKEHTLYIDQVELAPSEKQQPDITTKPAIQARAFERHIDITWNNNGLSRFKYIKIYRSTPHGGFQPVGIQDPMMGRYTDFTGEADKTYQYKVTLLDQAYKETAFSDVVTASTFAMTDEQLLNMVQEAHFRYYWEGAEPASGLARENIPGRKDMIATGASGFGLMAIITAIDRGFITREEGVQRFLTITSFLEKADSFHGAVSHFIDGPTGKTVPFFGPKDNGGDLVETSFLYQGLLVAHQYFNKATQDEQQIRHSINTLWQKVEWDWYKQFSDSPYLYWHWSSDQEWVINHKLVGWNETMITYLLAIMSPTHAIAPEMYYTGWASQDLYAQEYRAGWGKTKDGSMYTNGNTYYGEKLDVGVSNGGPLFFIHYSYLGLNPHLVTDKYTNYFVNNRKMAKINLRYCIENPGKYQGYGPDFWGLTASDFGFRYQAPEPVLRMDNGTMAPTGALSSFPYTPEASMAALKNYYRNYGYILWGEYGFRDAINLTDNWCSPIFMGLNQAPVTVMIENYRSGLIWELFMSHPDVQNGLRKLGTIKE